MLLDDLHILTRLEGFAWDYFYYIQNTRNYFPELELLQGWAPDSEIQIQIDLPKNVIEY